MERLTTQCSFRTTSAREIPRCQEGRAIRSLTGRRFVVPKYPAESYTTEEVRRLLEASGDTWVGKRNRALIVVMWRTGLRLAEALSLRIIDIDWQAQTIRVLHGKGDRARTVGIDRRALDVVQEYLNSTDRTFGPDSPLFCTRRGDKIQQSYVRAFLSRLARQADVRRRVHAHGFRHTFAVEMAREGV